MRGLSRREHLFPSTIATPVFGTEGKHTFYERRNRSKLNSIRKGTDTATMIIIVRSHYSLLLLLLIILVDHQKHQYIIANAQPHQHTGPRGHRHRHGRWWRNHNAPNHRKRRQGDTAADDQGEGFDPRTANAIWILTRQPKPRGLLHGIWKLAKSTAQGIAVGATSLVAFPLATLMLLGSQTVGPASILLATVVGGLAGFSLLGYSLWTGVSQCYWGLVHFPKAIQSSWRGFVWNQQSEQWEKYSLEEDYASSILSNNNKESILGEGGNHDYYELLGVPATANKTQIRRAYHKAAKRLHPDKNPTALEQFLIIHRAYEILYNDIQRAQYNASVDDANIRMLTPFPLDPKIYFSILLDSYDVLHPYTGDLPIIQWTFTFFRSGLLNFDDNHNDDEDNYDTVKSIEFILQNLAESKQRSQSRQVVIAMHLKEIAEPFVSGIVSEENFRLWAACEARRIYHHGALGTTQQALVGQALKRSSTTSGIATGCCNHDDSVLLRLIWWPIFGTIAYVRKTIDELQQKCTLVCTSFRLLKDLTSNQGFDEGDDHHCQIILSRFLQVVQILNALDISNTIDGATWKLIHDSNISREEAARRVRAIAILGDEFSNISKISKGLSFVTDDTDLKRLNIAENLAAGYESKVSISYVSSSLRRGLILRCFEPHFVFIPCPFFKMPIEDLPQEVNKLEQKKSCREGQTPSDYFHDGVSQPSNIELDCNSKMLMTSVKG